MFESPAQVNGFKHVAEITVDGVSFYLGKRGAWHLDLQKAELFVSGTEARDAAALSTPEAAHREYIQSRLVRRGLVLINGATREGA